MCVKSLLEIHHIKMNLLEVSSSSIVSYFFLHRLYICCFIKACLSKDADKFVTHSVIFLCCEVFNVGVGDAIKCIGLGVRLVIERL